MYINACTCMYEYINMCINEYMQVKYLEICVFGVVMRNVFEGSCRNVSRPIIFLELVKVIKSG